jgi:hypothetical protein
MTRPLVGRITAPIVHRRLARSALVAWGLFPLTLTLGLVRLAWGSVPALLLLACVAGGTMWALRQLGKVGHDQDRAVERSITRRIAVMLGVAAGGAVVVSIQSPTGLGMYPVQLMLFTPLAGLIALALAVIAGSCREGFGQAWVRSGHQSGTDALRRIATLALGSGLAAAIGGCIAAQGLRDGTPVHAMAFYVVVPLAGLIIGGQHWLPRRLRLAGALLGAFVVAGLTPLGGDNLDTAAPALLLAALFAVAWRWASPPPGSLVGRDTTMNTMAPEQGEHHVLAG